MSAGDVLVLRAIAVIGPDEAGALDLGLLPRPLRRGLSEVMKLAIAVAGRTLAAAGMGGGQPTELPIVYGSAFGETRTALELLTTITRAGESSPVLFRHSVHNAAPGLLSIALGSGAPATAVAAGEETVMASMFEARALLREGHAQVLVVLADDAIPAELSADTAARPGAVAWVLAAANDVGQGHAVGFLSGPERGGAAAPLATPLAPAYALHAALERQASSSVALSSRHPWRLRVARTRQELSSGPPEARA